MSSTITIPNFKGTNAKKCEEFVQAVSQYALQEGKQRDDGWVAEFAGTHLQGRALRWHTDLDESTQSSWKLLKKALFECWPLESESEQEAESGGGKEVSTPDATIPTPAAAPRSQNNGKIRTNEATSGPKYAVYENVATSRSTDPNPPPYMEVSTESESDIAQTIEDPERKPQPLLAAHQDEEQKGRPRRKLLQGLREHIGRELELQEVQRSQAERERVSLEKSLRGYETQKAREEEEEFIRKVELQKSRENEAVRQLVEAQRLKTERERAALEESLRHLETQRSREKEAIRQMMDAKRLQAQREQEEFLRQVEIQKSREEEAVRQLMNAQRLQVEREQEVSRLILAQQAREAKALEEAMRSQALHEQEAMERAFQMMQKQNMKSNDWDDWD